MKKSFLFRNDGTHRKMNGFPHNHFLKNHPEFTLIEYRDSWSDGSVYGHYIDTGIVEIVHVIGHFKNGNPFHKIQFKTISREQIQFCEIGGNSPDLIQLT